MAYLDVYTVTFNCARNFIQPEVFASHLFDALPTPRDYSVNLPDFIVLSIQEVAPIAHSFLGGSYLIPYFNKFRHALQLAPSAVGNGDAKYINVITRNVGMTAAMVFAKQENVGAIRWLESAGVGVGVHEMGNKGAVGIRMGYSTENGGNDEESLLEITFVAAHLAPMEDALDRRNEDWKNIVRGLVFPPTGTKALSAANRHLDSEEEPLLGNSPNNSTDRTEGIYTPTSHVVVAGDLNYRTRRVKAGPTDHHAYPQPIKDPSDPKHFSHLLKDDQLTRELEAGKTCHGFREASINFPPTYKYSDKQSAFTSDQEVGKWDWSKHRWPSWCDRILFLELPPWLKDSAPSARLETHGYTALPHIVTSDHRPVALSLSFPLMAIPQPGDASSSDDPRIQPPFSINPQWKEKRAAARRKEIFVGLLAYLGLTREGNGILLALFAGSIGGWLVIRSLIV
ncbi:MAG: hypothetical protein M1827_004540 [Pycnora praestabilis]|nr:MAG: hypothetical protein M1827_004540 [Pycnora praestabilis]